MKFLSDILAKAGLTVDGVVTLNNTATGQTPNANDNSTKLATTAWVRTFVQPYSLPIATSSVLGGIKVGTGLSIDAGTGVLSVSGGGAASIKSTQTFTATAGQTVFTISGGYIVGLIDVFLNGVYLSPNQTTATNGTTITLGDAALAGDIIDVIIASPVYQGATTTTDQLSEGSTNLYFTNARARAAISESVTGLDYNSATGVLSITTGYGIPTTASQTTWDAAYNDKINSAAVTGTTTKTLTLTQQDGGTITASWTDDNTDAVTSVFGRTGAVVATSGDYTTAQVTEVTNLYYTDARARAAISVTGSGSYDSATGIITVTGGVTSVNTLTGAVTLTTTNIGEGTNLYYTTARANSDFDTRLGTKSTTNLAEGTNLYYTTARANSDFDTRLATKSTTNLAEGTNLYYTDTRVGTYLTGNSYATQSYVSTQINNLVSGAPGLLDTLDELAAALGDDPNFATTVSTALSNRLRIDIGTQGLTGTQQGYGRTNLGLGSLATLSSIGDAYITDLAYSKLTGVPSTFAPSAHTHDDRYYTETEIGNFFSGASAITGYNKTNWDTAYGWGNHASGGYLTTASAASTYVSLSGSYANPSWITSLAYSKITGVPAFITSYTEVDTLASVTGRGTSTSTALTLSGGATITGLTIAKSGTDSIITFPAQLNDPAYIKHYESNNTAIMYFVASDDANDYFHFGYYGNTGAFQLRTDGVVTTGTWQGTAIADTYISSAATWNAKQNALNGTGFVKISGTTISYDNNTYLTGITSTLVTNALGFTPYNSSNPNGYITSSSGITGAAGKLSSRDIRTIAPNSENAAELRFGFTSWANNNSAPYADYLHLRSYSDSSGGSDNLVMFLKSGIGMRIWQQSFGSGTAYSSYVDVYHTGNLTNLNQLSNGPGYITGYTETDTLASVTGRGATTSTAITISGVDSALKVQHDGTSTAWRGRLGSFNSSADKASFLGNYTGRPGVFGHNNALSAWAELYVNTLGVHGHGTLYLSWDTYVKGNGNDTNYGIWHSGNLTNLNQLSNGPGYITSSATTLTLTGNLTVSSGNTTGGGIILADDGDIVDLNDAYCSMRFSYGVRIFSANRGGTPVITLANTGAITANGPISASNISSSIIASYIVQRDANGYIYANHVNFNTSENENPTISSFITSNGDGWSRKSSLAHVKNSIRGVADGTWGINISGNAATSSYSSLDFRHSDRDFPAGTLVQTNINYAVSSGDAFVLEIRGNSYFNTIPFDVQIQGYIYGDTIISTGGYSNGKYIDGIRAINFNGNLCFWWPSGGYWEGFNVKVYAAFASFPSNRVTSITNSTQPTTAKQVNFSPVQSLHSGNFNSYAPSLTGGNASGTWGINITGNAGSVNSRTVGNGKGNIGYFDANGNLYISNPESYSGEVRLGAAWNRGGIYTSSTLSLSTGSGTIDMVYSDTTRFRYYYDSNGTRFMVNTTSTPYTLIDGEARPVMYVRGRYPVLTLDHTVTSNTLHGPTIQFVFDGLSSRQWVIGTAGNGSQMDFGMSNAALSNTNYNPHNGIGGYQGKTLMRMTETGVLIGDCGTYPTNNTPSYALQVNGAISCNDIVRTSNFRLAGTLVLSGSGAEIGNSTGTRMTESYGVVWNCGNGATWHHQVINGSSLCGLNAGGGNFGSGNYYGTGDVTAYYSDERLKTKLSTITDAIEKIKSLEGFVYIENDLARSLGYTNEKEQAGVSAQQIQAVLPQAVSLAPFDMQGVAETGEVVSKTGENYLTVKYDRIVPLLIEGIKEQQTQIESQKSEIDELKDLVQQLINR